MNRTCEVRPMLFTTLIMAWVMPTALTALVIVAVLAHRPATGAASSGEPAVSFTAVQMIVTARCLPCHSPEPIQPGFSAPPKGVVLDTPEHIRAEAARIRSQAVDTKNMPLGNLTGMTDEERALLRTWLSQPKE